MKKYIELNENGLNADFEGYYRDVADPWGQSENVNRFESRRLIAAKWVEKLFTIKNLNRACEIGSGLGHLTAQLVENSIDCVGTDISPSAISRARELHGLKCFHEVEFADWGFYKSNGIDLFILSEITWYILKDLEKFKQFLRLLAIERRRPVYLIHLLSVYPPGVQKHGTDFFTDLDSILEYFSAEYLEYGQVNRVNAYGEVYHGTYFIGKFSG